MSYNKPISRVAVVGTGVIGSSWAAQYLARGFDVIATNPNPNAEANLRKYVDEAWEQLNIIGLSAGAARDRLTFTTNMKEALSKADLVQENGPERPDFKIKLFADMDDAVSWGPGLRWGIMGPNLQFHLAGGADGIKHFLEGVFVGLSPVMNALGNPKITPELKQKIVDGVLEEAGNRSVQQLAKEENEVLLKLLSMRAKADSNG